MRTVPLPSGGSVPVLGLGTWYMGERRERRADETAALRLGLDLGMTLVDTAEMYGDGAAEELIAEAVGDRRSECFLVSKVLPQHATRRGTISACEASLKRLKTDVIDLYLLHWRGRVPLADTLEGFDALLQSGKIRHWGVSNFDTSDMEELLSLAGTARPPAALNQVLYNLTRRGIEWDLLPWCRTHRVPVMAYSPIEQGRLGNDRRLKNVAARRNATPAQVALAWVLQQEGVIAIPKAGRVEHVHENRAALDITLTAEDLAELDKAFQPPTKKKSLDML